MPPNAEIFVHYGDQFAKQIGIDIQVRKNSINSLVLRPIIMTLNIYITRLELKIIKK